MQIKNFLDNEAVKYPDLKVFVHGKFEFLLLKRKSPSCISTTTEKR